MPTIYDVAKLAKVSISTVSNFVNQTAYVSPDKRKAIQEAIEQLQYRPNTAARKLKLGVSQEIAVVLPNLREKLYSEIMTGLHAYLQANGFKTLVYLTDDLPTREKQIVGECLDNDLGGLILCTCRPDETEWLAKAKRRMPVVFIVREPRVGEEHFIGFDNAAVVYKMTDSLLRLGHGSIGLYTGPDSYSSENDCVAGYRHAFSEHGLSVDETRLFRYPFSKEHTFRIMLNLFKEGSYPDIWIASSRLIAKSIEEAAYFCNLRLREDLHVLALGEEQQLYNIDAFDGIVSTYRPSQRLGEEAGKLLVENIRSPVAFETTHIRLTDDFPYHRLHDMLAPASRRSQPRKRVSESRPLRLLLIEEHAGTDAIRKLASKFSSDRSIPVHIDTLPHERLYEKLIEIAATGSDEYDLLSVDVPWLPFLASKNGLLDLTERTAESTELTGQLIEGALEKLGMFENRVYGIPYLYATQVLFYRKDLFEDPRLRSDFEKEYKTELAPPKTWFSFNLIAKYFTRKYNPRSPTLYGTACAASFSEALAAELHGRINGYQGEVIDGEGNVALYSAPNIRAFKSYAESLDYCDPTCLQRYRLQDAVKDFYDGRIAMAVTFISHASDIVDRTKSNVLDKIGCDFIPGKAPVLGGWSLSINRNSTQADRAFEWIRWLLSPEISLPFTILSGNSTLSAIYRNSEALNMYPWLKIALESFMLCKKRTTPYVPGLPIIPETRYEHILANVLYRYFRSPDRSTIEELVKHAHEELRNLTQSYGYKQKYPYPLHEG